jgi:hypothetical protein
MSPDEELPRCAVCRKQQTADAYELGDYEMDTLVYERRVRTAPRLQRKYGAVPICRPCFDSLGFRLENERPGEGPLPLVRITRRK